MVVTTKPPRFLPHDLIIQILLRLPVKSLLRFKSVGKSWFSLISDFKFAKSHFHLARTRRIIFFLTLPPRFRSIDFEAFLNDDPDPNSPNRVYWIPETCSSRFRTHNHVINYWIPKTFESNSRTLIKGSCGGFIFLYCHPRIYLWNPSIDFKKQIPVSPFDFKLLDYTYGHLYGFGYDESRDDFLIVVLTHDPTGYNVSLHLEVFSVRDNMWKEIEGTHSPYLNDMAKEERKDGLLFNGAIHWLAVRHDLGATVIVAFDLKERKLLEISLPDDFNRFVFTISDLWVFGEYLSLWEMDEDNINTMTIWVMNKYNDHSSWTKTLVFSLDAIGENYFNPLYFTKNGEIIGTDHGDRLVKYNDKGQLLEHRFYSNFPSLVYAMYTESLISLPGDNEQI